MENKDNLNAAAWSFIRQPSVVANDLLKDVPVSEGPPAYLSEAKRRAEELGIDLNAILQDDAERLEHSALPTADCLAPSEVETYWAESAELPEQKRAHASECEFCQRVLVASRPSTEQLERFLDEIGSFVARASIRQAARLQADA